MVEKYYFIYKHNHNKYLIVEYLVSCTNIIIIEPIDNNYNYQFLFLFFKKRREKIYIILKLSWVLHRLSTSSPTSYNCFKMTKNSEN